MDYFTTHMLCKHVLRREERNKKYYHIPHNRGTRNRRKQHLKKVYGATDPTPTVLAENIPHPSSSSSNNKTARQQARNQHNPVPVACRIVKAQPQFRSTTPQLVGVTQWKNNTSNQCSETYKYFTRTQKSLLGVTADITLSIDTMALALLVENY